MKVGTYVVKLSIIICQDSCTDMKVLIVNTSERVGGAAVAANRLMKALNKNGVAAKMLVNNKSTDDLNVLEVQGKWRKRFNFVLERGLIYILNGFTKERLFEIDPAFTGCDITKLPCFKEADIIHLHWVNQGMLSLGNLRKVLESGKPVVWTMHDFWPLTSVCHHNGECRQFETGCKDCSLVWTKWMRLIVRDVFRRKKKAIVANPLSFISVSSWASSNIESSPMGRGSVFHVIPNMLDLDNDFVQLDKHRCRELLNLPSGKLLLLFGAARLDNPIKGLEKVLESIGQNIVCGGFRYDEVCLVTFGESKSDSWKEKVPVPLIEMGKITENKRLCMLYSACDILISASYKETFGQTLIEAMACGCVPVSFDSGGPRDIIVHKENGYLAKAGDIDDLAKGLLWAMNMHTGISLKLRQYVCENYSDDRVAHNYEDLYTKILLGDKK